MKGEKKINSELLEVQTKSIIDNMVVSQSYEQNYSFL